MEEMVHRPPALLNELFPDHNAPLSRYLISAPRCYCFLTHYPFFPLHFKVWQKISLGLLLKLPAQMNAELCCVLLSRSANPAQL